MVKDERLVEGLSSKNERFFEKSREIKFKEGENCKFSISNKK
jgi:hypothetical protein